MKQFLIGLIFLLCAVTLFAPAAKADTIGVNFSSVNIDFTNGQWSLGYQFRANVNTSVTQLGFYDDLKNGLTENHTVGLFNSVGNLLAQTTVTNASTLTSFFRFNAIAPVALTAGSIYYVAATTGTENYTWDPNGVVIDPDITFIADAFIASNVLAFPTQSNGSGLIGWFGANIQTAAAPIPEPGTLLLLGSGLCGIVGIARRRKKATPKL